MPGPVIYELRGGDWVTFGGTGRRTTLYHRVRTVAPPIIGTECGKSWFDNRVMAHSISEPATDTCRPCVRSTLDD